MSDPKRSTLITVGAPKSAKNTVKKTVRLTINLDESNERKYPELNYKELVIAEERKKRVENGKTSGLDPFSDNDDDVERVARKFEQKYGGKSTYGRKGRTKMDDFADIGAGYDESDSFIDNTHGYDEMIPPECDTFYGGFYINCGSLEFKSVPENQMTTSDEDQGNRRNKRRISSSSSEEESESSSGSESPDEKDPKAIANGEVDSHKTEHRKKKNKKVEKKKAKKVRRTDSSAATSGKQTSDDNAHGDAESADSRTSHSDSLTSKPAPSSENAITSDSSRDVEPKAEIELPAPVLQAMEALEAAARKQLVEVPNLPSKEVFSKTEQYITRLEQALTKCESQPTVSRCAWSRAASALCTTRSKLLQMVKARSDQPPPDPAVTTAQATATVAAPTVTAQKRKQDEEPEEDFSQLTEEQREAKIGETLQRLKALIEDRKPGMIANYNAECKRVQEERKKMQQSAAEGAPHVEKRLPKRRFPWCGRARSLLARLRRLAPGPRAPDAPDAAAALLATRVLPLFPPGFVRMPTLLRQADLSKEVKVSEMKRQRLGSTSLATAVIQPPVATLPEPIQFPSSLTVTTSSKPAADKPETPQLPDDTKYKSNVFNSMLNSFSLTLEKNDKEKKEELYVPPNNIGSITITPVPNQAKIDKKSNSDKGFIRVKSPAALNEMVNKKKEKNNVKEKPIDTPLHVDTNYQSKEPSKKAEVTQKQIENMRVSENNIPRPALVPVQHSPTFAKPDKRPPEVKKKKDIVIVSDVDPLGDNIPEPLAIDDSSSDVELVEEKTEKSDLKSEVPSKDVRNNQKKVSNSKTKGVIKVLDSKSESDEVTKDEFDTVMRNLREMESSQDPSMSMNSSNSYSGVITNAKHGKQSEYNKARGAFYADSRRDRDKLAEPTSLRITDGCNTVTGANAPAVKMIKS